MDDPFRNFVHTVRLQGPASSVHLGRLLRNYNPPVFGGVRRCLSLWRSRHSWTFVVPSQTLYRNSNSTNLRSEGEKLHEIAMLHFLTLCWSVREREEMRPQIPHCHDEYDESSWCLDLGSQLSTRRMILQCGCRWLVPCAPGTLIFRVPLPVGVPD